MKGLGLGLHFWTPWTRPNYGHPGFFIHFVFSGILHDTNVAGNVPEIYTTFFSFYLAIIFNFSFFGHYI